MPLRSGSPIPSFEGASEWVNGEPAPAGGPTLVHFWSVSCYLCKENMPEVREWVETYAPRGLRVIAVHMPRQESDLCEDRVRELIAELGITEPCALDNERGIADAFQNEWVPAYFLFDAAGTLRSRAAGQNGVPLIRSALARLLE